MSAGSNLTVTVLSGNQLKNTEVFSRQDPYARIQYGQIFYRTKTHTDGGKNPQWNEKFIFPVTQHQRTLYVQVFNANTITSDDLLGSASVDLTKCFTTGYDDSPYPLYGRSGKQHGEIRLVLHCDKPAISENLKPQPYQVPQQYAVPPPAPPQYAAPPPAPPQYAAPPPAPYPVYAPQQAYGGYPPVAAYGPPLQQAPPGYTGYPPVSAYPPPQAYPPMQGGYNPYGRGV